MSSQEIITADELSRLSNDEILRRTLTPGSVLSTRSSYASRYQEAVSNPNDHKSVEIGVGLQGAIFEQLGNPFCYKKEHPNNCFLRTSLLNEHYLHIDVETAFHTYDPEPEIQSHVHVPRLMGMNPFHPAHQKDTHPDDKFWSKTLPKLPPQYQSRDQIAEMERILPLPKIARQALIRRFYPLDADADTNGNENQEIYTRLLNSTPNKHCLVRPYLGREHSSSSSSSPRNPPRKPQSKFSLRNLPLHLSDMQSLNLDVKALATSMGKSFALMHWGAGVNGDDVEFVLGTTALPVNSLPHIPENQQQSSSDSQEKQQLRTTQLFLLDFGQCDSVNLGKPKGSLHQAFFHGRDPDQVEDVDADVDVDIEEVYQSFKGAMVTGDNQLFIPNCKTNKDLWGVFKEAYITAGRCILVKKCLDKIFNVEDFMREYEEYAEDFL